MALTLSIGTTKKRHNSMLVPSLNSSISVVLKESTSVENPVFQIQGDFDAGWNYCHCAEFGRYYWITDASFDRGVWYIACSTDYLASYKDEILANTCYVTRSASLFHDDITDTLFPCTATPSLVQSTSSSLSVNNTGSIIVCTAGTGSGNAFYGMSVSEFGTLLSYLYSRDYFTGLNSFVSSTSKEIAHPEDYLLSAIWVPISLAGDSNIPLGYLTSPATGQRLTTGKIWGQVVSLSIPKHPNSEGYTYRNLAPFTEYTLTIPFYGTIPIDADAVYNSDTLYIGFAADVTGALEIGVFTNSKEIFRGHGNFGSPVGYSSRSTNTIGTLSSIASGAVSALTGNPLGVASSIVSGFQNIYPRVNSSGGSGGTMFLDDFATMNATFYIQKTVDATHFGRPLCQPQALSGLSGYCRTEGASVSCSATDTGINEINRMLDGGVYIE